MHMSWDWLTHTIYKKLPFNCVAGVESKMNECHYAWLSSVESSI